MSAARLRASTLAVVVLLTLGGFGLRMFHLNTPALRGDEVFTVLHWVRSPLADTLATLATVDPQPPLAVASYRAWGLLVGPDERAARLLPALAGTLGIPALYALGRRLAGPRAGLLAAFLWAIHPFQVWHAQDARNYALWASASAIAAWLALRALDSPRRRDWALYVAAAATAAYLYYLELFVVAALTVYAAVIGRDRATRLRWLVALAAIGALLAPWYLQPRLFGGAYGGTTGGFRADLLVTWFLPTLAFGATIPAALRPPLGVAVALVALGAGIALWRSRRRLVLLAACLGLIPLALLALVSLRLNVFEPRYVLASAPALVLLLAGLATAPRPRAARWIGVAALAGWVTLSGVSLANYHGDPDYAKSHDWLALLHYLRDHAAPGDIVVQAAADEAFNFYFDSLGLTFDRKQLPANPTQDEAEIVGLLAADARAHPSVWRVGQTFPDWPSYGIVERWLEEQMQPVRAARVGRLDARQYRPWDVSPDELAAPLGAFADVAELAGAQVADDGAASDQATVWLYWRPLRATDSALKGTVQLIGPTNPATGTPLWSQDDHEPQGGRAATTRWTPGHVYRDVYVLPLGGVAPGDYTLVARLYDPTTGERLLTGDEADGLPIGTLHAR